MTIRLDPDYPNTIRWHANALATHSFEYGAKEPVAALIDMVRYLAKVDEPTLFEIMYELDPSRPATMDEARDGMGSSSDQ